MHGDYELKSYSLIWRTTKNIPASLIVSHQIIHFRLNSSLIVPIVNLLYYPSNKITYSIHTSLSIKQNDLFLIHPILIYIKINDVFIT
jgi:hypothetical protein